MSSKSKWRHVGAFFDPIATNVAVKAEPMDTKDWQHVGSTLDPFVTKNVIKNVDKEKDEAARQKAVMNASLLGNQSTLTSETVDTAAQEAARAEEEKMRKRKGYKSTILTGPSGITTPAVTQKTTLG